MTAELVSASAVQGAPGPAARRRMPPRRLLLVAGMHRSGTSVLTECLAASGWALPRDIGAPAPDAPRGHFEPRALVDLHDRLLGGSGLSWDSLGDGAEAAPRALRAARDLDRQIDAALAESFGAAGACIVKDPRLARLPGLWAGYLARRRHRPVLLLPLRHPAEVAASLALRNAMPAAQAALLWLAHVCGALRLARGCPTLILRFPHWTRDPAAAGAALAALLEEPDLAPRFAAAAGEAVLARSPGRGQGAASDAGRGEAERRAAALHDALAALVAGAGEGPAFRLPEGGVSDDLTRPAEATLADARAAQDWALARLPGRPATGDGRSLALAARARSALADRDAMLARAQAERQEKDADIAELRAVVAETEARAGRDIAAVQAAAAVEAAALHDLASRQAAELAQIRQDAARRDAEARDDIARLDRALLATVAANGALADAGHRWREAQAAPPTPGRAAEPGPAPAAQGPAATRAPAPVSSEGQDMPLFSRFYRRLYSGGGRILRRIVSERRVEALKRRLPAPGGIPPALALPPPPAASPARPAPVAPRGEPGRDDIFVLSIIDWDFRTQRPQHLAREWARAGHRVFYVEMEREAAAPQCRRLGENLYVIRLGVDALDLIPTYVGVPRPSQARAWLHRLFAFCDGVAASPTVQVVVQHPYWWNFARHLPPQFRLTFDCMDEISGFSNTTERLIADEAELASQADCMLVSSDYLRRKHQDHREVTLVRNGADLSHFDPAGQPPEPAFLAGPRRDAPRPLRVGYVGAIAEWFDHALLARVADLLPEAQFHLCGAVTAPGPLALRDRANVVLHGEIAYADVPGFLAAMDVLVIPFRLDPIILACDPVKFYEYAAMGKPVVATPMPELERAGDLLWRAGEAEEFAAAIRKAAVTGGDPARIAALQAYARDNAWDSRAATALAAMTAEPRVSVVVLSYGDPELTLATLHSLLEDGGCHPALEVIVVDNGSTQQALDRVAGYLARHRGVRLIAAGQNLGFAAGNNLGIRAAQGDYVLLLNNDTYVPPGAIRAMVGHLQRNRNIGVVGPLTNNIGNEARVDIDYADMTGMRAAARLLTAGYRGHWTEIPVAAYFCAMFRRADFDRFGLLDPAYGRGMFEDDDHCAVIRAQGMTCALAEDAFVHHHLSASFDRMALAARQELFARNRAIYEGRWGPWVPHRYRERRPPGTLGPQRPEPAIPRRSLPEAA
ncbi:MAG: hypothetical protein RLZZ528_791 [Pseudomonadota bacterium]